ncbi:MAG: hypothetical protein HKN73_02350 [Gemmatimonadetes bacterium]|nr:hypothetical protein [Gemmatimonadota bacterium]
MEEAADHDPRVAAGAGTRKETAAEGAAAGAAGAVAAAVAGTRRTKT